ncbi:MAG: hypothetical protein AAB706_01945, partial [Patescibacteria group bacterium]
MSDNLIIRGEKYISARRAGEIVKYQRDYIGQLCRAGKVECSFIGRGWFVSERSIVNHKNYYAPENAPSRIPINKIVPVQVQTNSFNEEEQIPVKTTIPEITSQEDVSQNEERTQPAEGLSIPVSEQIPEQNLALQETPDILSQVSQALSGIIQDVEISAPKHHQSFFPTVSFSNALATFIIAFSLAGAGYLFLNPDKALQVKHTFENTAQKIILTSQNVFQHADDLVNKVSGAVVSLGKEKIGAVGEQASIHISNAGDVSREVSGFISLGAKNILSNIVVRSSNIEQAVRDIVASINVTVYSIPKTVAKNLSGKMHYASSRLSGVFINGGAKLRDVVSSYHTLSQALQNTLAS